MSNISLQKIRISFVALGVVLWGLASYLFEFTKNVTIYDAEGNPTVHIMPVYWVEIIALFAAGIAFLTFVTVYGKINGVKKSDVGLAILGTSALALGVFLTFGVPLEASSSGLIPAGAFLAVIAIVVGIMIIAFGALVFFYGLRHPPWNYLKPKKVWIFQINQSKRHRGITT